jgi:hypothetical protein
MIHSNDTGPERLACWRKVEEAWKRDQKKEEGSWERDRGKMN